MDRTLLADLRHECRTLLNHIMGYSQMLLEDVEDAGQSALVPSLRRIDEEARRLLGLVNDFLAPSRVEAGAVDLERMPAGLSAPLREIIASSESLKERAADASGDFLRDVERISLAAKQLETLVTQGLSAERRAGVTAPGEAETVSAEPGAGPAEGGVILLVDDDASNRDILSRLLQRQGCQVRLAASGRQALAVLRGQHVDLVLLDLMMPEMNGYEVLQQVKSDPSLRDIPVLMLSAVDEIKSAVRCIELGAEDYLSKPFEPVLLRARVGASLGKKRSRDQEVRHLRDLADWNKKLEERCQEEVAKVDRLTRLKRFLSPQLAELIVSVGAEDPLKSHRRDIAVVFLDLRGFTAFTEAAEPEEVMGVLREYHAEMGRLVREYEGTLERFTGDGMMIIFNDPVVIPNPAERAVRMAVAMRHAIGELRIQWARRGVELDFGVGIDFGYATIGAIGFENRWDYTAIGNVPNLAARLCGEARPGQILVSQRVFGGVEHLIEAEPVGKLTLKGFHQPVAAYNILRLKG